MCRSALLTFPDRVPTGIWVGLWDALARVDSADYVERMTHIKYIGDDLRKADVRMDFDQRMLYIEALIVQGLPEDQHVSLEVWETSQAAALRSGKSRIYYELGVKVFCHRAELDRALLTAETLLESWDDDVTAYRVLLPIIQTNLTIGSPAAVQTAWRLYLRLRFHLGSEMTMEDYDIIGLSFLEANEPDLALASFRDMMLTPSEKGKKKKKLADASTGLAELSHFKPRSLARLPPQFNNKYFFGSWMKKLIGEGEIGAAKRVLDITLERGICPDSRHVNGIIGAWIREGTESSLAKAEDMAWRMINARLKLVRDRNARKEIPPGGSLRIKAHARASTQMPAATIETFCILIQRYRRRARTNELLALFDTLRKAEVQPNTYFMNELLDMDSKSQRGDWAWMTYLSLAEKGVRPDYQTFTTLWHHSCKVSKGVVKKGENKAVKYPKPAIIFQEMVKNKDELLRRNEPFPRELYDFIIFAFSLKEDQAGSAVALMALQKHFNAPVKEETARTVVLQLTRLGQQNESGYKPRRLKLKTAASKARISKVTKMFGEFKQRRDEFLLSQGRSYESLSQEEKLDEARIVLSDLLRYAFETSTASEEREILTAPEVSKRTAQDMGVPDCVAWFEEA